MALKVEGIVGGGMHAQKALGGSTVTRIDRLARSTAIVKQIVEAKAQFRSLAEPWVDTGTSTGRLMIAVLGGLADVERDLIRTRTAEGRSRAQRRGQRMGRPSRLTDAQKAEARRRRGGRRDIERACPKLRCQPRHDFSACEAINRIFANPRHRSEFPRTGGRPRRLAARGYPRALRCTAK
jgi:Resolvase, N terminal domain